ncbi:MAG TPA: hypothetical protein H9867_07585 [Candidatus Corynebacterium gallistercoris]|uniref:YtxH domain-containing protein n=1 Tax=Candidatus Corynebacterium gallistercoris TaxID=2838530 RepID=A0A9D1RZ76_9CORY|nr:hypothetical protein [Candidatus Corynebacterium gallistercoris]
MIQFVVGAAAGYLMGTKAGRRRYEQIRRGYETAVNSDVTKAAVRAGRKAIANKLDPEPRMHEVRDLNRSTRSSLADGHTIVEADHAHPNDQVDPPRSDKNAKSSKNPFKR